MSNYGTYGSTGGNWTQVYGYNATPDRSQMAREKLWRFFPLAPPENVIVNEDFFFLEKDNRYATGWTMAGAVGRDGIMCLTHESLEPLTVHGNHGWAVLEAHTENDILWFTRMGPLMAAFRKMQTVRSSWNPDLLKMIDMAVEQYK